MLTCFHCGWTGEEGRACLVDVDEKWTRWRCPECKKVNGILREKPRWLINSKLDHWKIELRVYDNHTDEVIEFWEVYANKVELKKMMFDARCRMRMKGELRYAGLPCFESDCPIKDDCEHFGLADEECLCGVCLEHASEDMCLCHACEVGGENSDCTWREDCGYYQLAEKFPTRKQIEKRGW